METSPFYDPKRILLFVDSEEINHRVRALDILCQYLLDIDSCGLTTDPTTDNSLKIPISFAILTRCDDISPEVRVQALKVLSRIAKIIIKFFHETKEETIFKIEDGVDISKLELEVNGEHRFFWYCMESFEERQKELMAIIHRRIHDGNISVRKSAIIAFQNLILAENDFATKKNLKCLKSALNDPDFFVRKLSMQSISIILDANQNDPEIQELWIHCILPLVDDPEDKIQSAALSLLEKKFLLKVFAPVELEENLFMALLEKLTSEDFSIYHKFVKMAFSEWKLQNKLNAECVKGLLNCVGTEWEKCVWFYLSLFTSYCPIPVEFCSICTHDISVLSERGEYPTFIQHIIKTFLHMLKVLPEDVLTYIQGISIYGLASFIVPVELIPMYFDMVVQIHKFKGTIPDLYEILASIVETCQSNLLNIKEGVLSGYHTRDDVVTKYFRTLAEIFLFRSSYITTEMIRLLVFFSGCNKNSVVLLSSEVKTHALLALGKICLQHKQLAHELLPVYLEEIISDDDTIRNNACLILVDMCKCYPLFTDKCTPIISLCVKDDLYLIRYQAILQIINLFQADYLKWKASIFFAFLSTLVDKKDVIRELGHYVFSHLLPSSERQMFLDYFTHSIFVFNYFSPPNNEKIADNVRKLIKFSIPGESRRKERLALYSFFLEQMDVKERAKAITFVCDVLTNVAESVYPLNKFTECLTRDCFAILICDEIKLIHLPTKNVNEGLENIVSEVERGVRRTVLVDPVIEVMGSLTSCVRNAESNLIRDIILFLKDVLSDFVDDITEILAEDKILLKQLKLKIRRDAERKRMEIKRKRDLLIARRNTNNEM